MCKNKNGCCSPESAWESWDRSSRKVQALGTSWDDHTAHSTPVICEQGADQVGEGICHCIAKGVFQVHKNFDDVTCM